MGRTTRLSGQLPSPPKSNDGSQSSDAGCEILSNKDNTDTKNNDIKKGSHADDALSSPNDRKSRVLRRQSIQNVSGEIRAFFAVSPLPAGKNKRDFLLSAVDRVSSLYDAPSDDYPDRGRQRRSQPDSGTHRRDSSHDTDVSVKKH